MKNVMILLLAVLAMLNVACTKTEVSGCKSSKQSFNEDLSSYVMKQKEILHGLKTRSASTTLTSEEIAAIAIKMDSVTLKFYNEHPEFVNSLPKVSEEQMEVLKENPDSLMTFVQRNYSEEVFNIVKEDLGSDRFILLEPSNISSAGDVPRDKFVKANLEINRDFKEVITENAANTYKPLIQESNKRTDCYKRYKNKVDNCYSTMMRSLILASISSVNPLGAITLSLSLLYIASDYNQCLYNASEFYYLCNGQK